MKLEVRTYYNGTGKGIFVRIMKGNNELAFGIGADKDKALLDMVRRYPGTEDFVLSLSNKK
jgi:hypothetical protein